MTFQRQIKQIKTLNSDHKEYWGSEFEGINWFSEIISKPENYKKNIYYHQANSLEDRNSILSNGFDFSKIANNNCGMGRGLYLGRDKQSLINFYSPGECYIDFTLQIYGEFKFYDCIEKHKKPKNPLDVIKLGYDGIRYYDPDATGEEFVLFKISKIKHIQ